MYYLTMPNFNQKQLTRRQRKHSRRSHKKKPSLQWHRVTHTKPQQTSVRCVLWNCQSVYPTHYHQWNDPDADISQSLKHNEKRYREHVRILRPYIARLLPNSMDPSSAPLLDAICLQEVDPPLVKLIVELLHKEFRYVCVHPKELIECPYYQMKDASYHLLTLVHSSRVRTIPQYTYKTFQRFCISSLDTCTLINCHIPWVETRSSSTSQERSRFLQKKHLSNIGLMMAMRRSIEAHIRAETLTQYRPLFICGDLNVSSTDNMKVYKRTFGHVKVCTALDGKDHRTLSNASTQASTQIVPVGESYNLQPQHIQRLKTFRSLTKPPDDTIICAENWQVYATYQSLKNMKLPVDTNGYLQPESNRWPSDHALAEVRLDFRG